MNSSDDYKSKTRRRKTEKKKRRKTSESMSDIKNHKSSHSPEKRQKLEKPDHSRKSDPSKVMPRKLMKLEPLSSDSEKEQTVVRQPASRIFCCNVVKRHGINRRLLRFSPGSPTLDANKELLGDALDPYEEFKNSENFSLLISTEKVEGTFENMTVELSPISSSGEASSTDSKKIEHVTCSVNTNISQLKKDVPLPPKSEELETPPTPPPPPIMDKSGDSTHNDEAYLFSLAKPVHANNSSLNISSSSQTIQSNFSQNIPYSVGGEDSSSIINSWNTSSVTHPNDSNIMSFPRFTHDASTVASQMNFANTSSFIPPSQQYHGLPVLPQNYGFSQNAPVIYPIPNQPAGFVYPFTSSGQPPMNDSQGLFNQNNNNIHSFLSAYPNILTVSSNQNLPIGGHRMVGNNFLPFTGPNHQFISNPPQINNNYSGNTIMNNPPNFHPTNILNPRAILPSEATTINNQFIRNMSTSNIHFGNQNVQASFPRVRYEAPVSKPIQVPAYDPHIVNSSIPHHIGHVNINGSISGPKTKGMLCQNLTDFSKNPVLMMSEPNMFNPSIGQRPTSNFVGQINNNLINIPPFEQSLTQSTLNLRSLDDSTKTQDDLTDCANITSNKSTMLNNQLKAMSPSDHKVSSNVAKSVLGGDMSPLSDVSDTDECKKPSQDIKDDIENLTDDEFEISSNDNNESRVLGKNMEQREDNIYNNLPETAQQFIKTVAGKNKSIAQSIAVAIDRDYNINTNVSRIWGDRNMRTYDVIMQVGEGTYGQVYKARDLFRDKLVALKKIRNDHDREGFPITAVREIKILRNLRHKNIVQLQDVITDKINVADFFRDKGSFYLVFEYMDHDLMGILESNRVEFSTLQIRSMFKQLMQAIEYCHKKDFLHRDIKCSNILINNKGVIKLADFGLARLYESEGRPYTNRVITLWYRPPELLLGEERYGPYVDIWSAGCILGQFFTKKPIFPGSQELMQLDIICQCCGSPSLSSWPEVTNLPLYNSLRPKYHYPRRLRQQFHFLPPAALDLLDKILTMDPHKRPSATEILESDFLINIVPEEIKAPMFPEKESYHEMYFKRKAREDRKRKQAEKNSSNLISDQRPKTQDETLDNSEGGLPGSFVQSRSRY